MTHVLSVDAFTVAARKWLDDNACRRSEHERSQEWGAGSDSTAVFHDLTPEEEFALLEPAVAWQRQKLAAGFAGLSVPCEYGGQGLTRDHERAFREAEAAYDTPPATETFNVTLGMIVPTILLAGSEDQKRSMVPELLSTDYLVCQLFSEPGAGSDLASLACRAERRGDRWIINGQKVWTSGARVSRYGELIARTDRSASRHDGMTAFLVPMDAPGVEIRPIRQMTGGASFNEVFFT